MAIITRITSRDNALIKHARAIREGKDREMIFIEGLRLCEEAVRARLNVQNVFFTGKFAQSDRGSKLLGLLEGFRTARVLVSETVFASISDTKTPQGIVVIASTPKVTSLTLLEQTVGNALFVIMHRVSNPANAGGMVRTAEAGGGTAVISTEGSVDLFSTKALRGSMGSVFRIPILVGADLSEITRWCRSHGIRTVCADARSERDYTSLDWTAPSAIIIGAEPDGLQPRELALAEATVRIPMRSPVESLNVGAACAVILYEAARQRATPAPR